MGGLLLRGSKRSGYRVPAYALINITYGNSRMDTVKHRQLQKNHQKQQQQQRGEAKSVTITSKKSTPSKNIAVNPVVPAGQTYHPQQFMAQFVQQSSMNPSQSWVPKNLPPNPMASQKSADVLSKSAPDTKSWVPAQPPPPPPPQLTEQKYNPLEFVAKFAQPACLIPPRTVESLPVDPRSAFSQVQVRSYCSFVCGRFFLWTFPREKYPEI